MLGAGCWVLTGMLQQFDVPCLVLHRSRRFWPLVKICAFHGSSHPIPNRHQGIGSRVARSLCAHKFLLITDGGCRTVSALGETLRMLTTAVSSLDSFLSNYLHATEHASSPPSPRRLNLLCTGPIRP